MFSVGNALVRECGPSRSRRESGRSDCKAVVASFACQRVVPGTRATRKDRRVSDSTTQKGRGENDSPPFALPENQGVGAPERVFREEAALRLLKNNDRSGDVQ